LDITEIRLGAAHTINLGNYNSMRVEAGLTISVKEGDSIADIRASAQTVLRNMLEETFRAQLKGGAGAATEGGNDKA
jgi:hypothetical protein